MDERSKKLARRSVSKVKAYQEVFAGPQGQIVLEDLMRTHFILGPTFSKDVHEMVLREGERNVILRILSLLKMDAKLLQERIRLNENSLE